MNQMWKRKMILLLALTTLGASGILQAEEAAPPTSEPKISDYVGYNKGFYLQTPDGNFKMTMGGYIQSWFSDQIVEDGSDVDSFRVRRARLKWAGNLYSKDIQYELEYDFSSSRLLEAVIQLVHSDSLKFRAGQFHVPFNFEGMASSSNLQFVNRSILQASFGIADEREPGAGFNGELMNKKIEYDVGMFNGEGINTLNANHEFRYAGRAVYNVMGKHGYEFVDYKDSQEPQVAFALGGMYNDTPDSSTIVAPSTTATNEKTVGSFTGDASVKYKGFSAHAGYIYQHANPEVGSTTTDHGWLAQLGYFVIPKKLEVAGRVAQVLKDGTGDQGEYTAGINYYMNEGHRGAKFQLNYSALTVEDGVSAGDNRLDHLVVAQLQLKI